MKFLVYILFFVCFSSFAQVQDSAKKELEIFTQVETMPEFPGGFNQMYKFISKNISYPNEEKQKKIGGKSFLKFTVLATGEIKDILVLQSSGNENLDKEAIRVVASMPKWKAATLKGKSVPVYFNLPINFQP